LAIGMGLVLAPLVEKISGEGREESRFHFGGEADSPRASGHFDALHPAERILRNRARARVELRDAHLLLDNHRLPVDDREPLAVAARDIRHVLRNQAPVPARLAIEVHDLPAGFLDAVGTPHRRAPHAIAEEVAAQERNTPAAIRAKATHADADGRLAEALELQLPLIVADLVLARRRQPRRAVL